MRKDWLVPPEGDGAVTAKLSLPESLNGSLPTQNAVVPS